MKDVHPLTLGCWLAGALQWHFAAMWLLAVNGMIYLAHGLASRNGLLRVLGLMDVNTVHASRA